MTEFRLLGPVEVITGAGVVDVGPPQRRSVLAALAVDAGRPVPVEVLIERVWGEGFPDGARRALQAHLTRIRRMLERVASGADDRVTLARRAGGYVLEAEPERVDLHRFRRLAERARNAGIHGAERLDLLREALALWRGEPLAGITGEWAARVREGWKRQRLDVVVAWADAELQTGEHSTVTARLRDLVAEYPLVEPLVAALMRALYASGSAAEALDCYAAMRKRLAGELGTEPGAELQRVHQAILRGDLHQPSQPSPASPASPASPLNQPNPQESAPARAVPAMLPLDVRGFAGRAHELARLDAVLAETAHHPTSVIISALSGTAGVGKTALAVRWAHRVCDRFPDGQLYVNLRGYDPQQPMTAADALADFLSALGMSGQDIPLDIGQRAARYRSAVSGRRMLVVLDNASSVEQARPLLPGSPTCVVVVTSRDSLAGLVALHGAQRIDLDLLPPPEAIALLRTLIGDRVEAEPEAAALLAGQCARLPLALRLVAELAAARPAASLAELAGELADQQRRLDHLDAGGDPRAAVRAVFSWSYQRLPADAARAFRLLSLHPGPGLDSYAVAALTGQSLQHARRALDLLARAHLVHPAAAGRYDMHDLLRAYAGWLVTEHDDEHERRAALTRLFDHYLATAATAMDTLYPAERHRRPRVAPPASPAPGVADTASARVWLESERPALLAVCAHAAGHGLPGHAVRLAATLYAYLDNGGHFADALTAHTHARHAAQQAGDLAGEAGAVANLGVVHWQLGDYEQAAGHLQRALDLFRKIGDQVGEARTVGNLGILHSRMGFPGRAFDDHTRALALFRELGDQVGEANTLANLGAVFVLLGRDEPAATHNLRALELFRELGHRGGEATALTNLGEVEARLGRYERAAEHFLRALDIFREIGERYGEACALNGLGDARSHGGAPADAVERHTAALNLAIDIGERDEEARAHDGLGHAYHALDDLASARSHWRQALSAYTELGVPAADDIRTRLDTLDTNPPSA
ncbi:BTAD domain-containing putative transcriptional regulator [Sphaerisporangium flaviroseum]|uniref:BTAD domain-containing putative transcriptional regulator n=1 Tax=Sphaerisporangium flaviroseum TaxID=509199 RepID=A0ABP7IQG7_9ACTN